MSTWIVARKLHDVAHGCVASAAKSVIGAVNIGEEERVEASPFQRVRHLGVIVEVAVAGRRAVQRMFPLAIGLWTNRTLGKRVEITSGPPRQNLRRGGEISDAPRGPDTLTLLAGFKKGRHTLRNARFAGLRVRRCQ
jgi:hypothetical protein